MSRQQEQCADRVLLRRFLDEQLTDLEESRVVNHLGDCTPCQQRLEALAGGDQSWAAYRDGLAESVQSTRQIAADSERMNSAEFAADAEDSSDAIALLGPTDDPAMLGRLGAFEVCGVIGRGSTGIVFKAFDASLTRFVAIKMLAPGYSDRGAARARFEREGRAIAAVRDEHVIAIHGVDEFGGAPFIVMQYLPGGSLQKRLDEQGPMSTKEVARIGMQIASGLAAAHRQGIIHRDVKPANVLLEQGVERAVVTDFGLARVADEAAVTHTGWISGTPQFMSPEQARGETLDHATDLFSLGAVLYALCTGHSPFRSETLLGVMHRVSETEPRPIREIRPEIDPWLADFVAKLLAKQPTKRFESAHQVAELLAEELAHLQEPTASPEPQRTWRMKPGKLQRRWWTRRRIAWASGSAAALSLAAAWAGFAWTGANRLDLAPTSLQSELTNARAAFDAADSLHRSRLALRGADEDLGATDDLTDVLDAHHHAMQLGFDPGKSAFRVACIRAVLGETESAFANLAQAIDAGFDDHLQLRSEPELASLRNHPAFPGVAARAEEIAALRAQGRTFYFDEKDYVAAESMFRQVLRRSPRDEYSAMLIGASLLLQGKLAESVDWHERAKRSVRFASFGHYNLACVAAKQTDAETAFDELRKAIDGGFADPDHLRNDPDLEFLRAYPQFSDLLHYAAERSQTK